jgi:hypothetical protein
MPNIANMKATPETKKIAQIGALYQKLLKESFSNLSNNMKKTLS